jgi:hypothetical protein
MATASVLLRRVKQTVTMTTRRRKNKTIEFVKYIASKWKEAYMLAALTAGLIAVLTKQIDWPTFGGFLAGAATLYRTLKSNPQ